MEKKSKKLTNSIIIVMASTLISRIIGFIREMLLPNMLGVGVETDAYLNAYMFPDLMYSLLMGGAIAAALIPVLTGYIETKDEKNGWKAVSTFANIIFLIMFVLCIVGMFFSKQLMTILISDPEKVQTRILAAKVSRILFPSVGFLMLSGLMNGVLNAHKKFAYAALGPIIYNIGNALSIYFLSSYGVVKIAYGVMASSILYFIIQLLFTFKHLKHYKPKLFPHHFGTRKIFNLAIPSFISASVVQINVMISTKFANFFESGNMTAYKMADKTWQMPYGIFAVSLGIAVLPTLSGMYAKKEKNEFSNLLIKSMKTIYVLILPCSVAFILLNKRIISTIFQFSSNFSEENVRLTSSVLLFFTIALVAQSLVTLFNRAFYAVHDTKIPLYAGTTTIIVNLGLSYIFYKFSSLDVKGMALAYSIASLTNAAILMIIMKNKNKNIDYSGFWKFILRLLPGIVIMSIAVIFMNNIKFNINETVNLTSKIKEVIYLMVISIIGAVVYFSSLILFRVKEGIEVYNRILKKIKLDRFTINVK